MRSDRRGQSARTERRLQLRKIDPAEHKPGEHPDARRRRWRRCRTCARAALQRAQNTGRWTRGRRWRDGATCRGCLESGEPRGRRGLWSRPDRERRPARALRRRARWWTIPKVPRARPRFPAPCRHPAPKRVLDRRQRRFRRILDLLRGVGHVVVASLLRWTRRGRNRVLTAPGMRAILESPRDPPRAAASIAPPRHPIAIAPSYRLGRPIETSC